VQDGSGQGRAVRTDAGASAPTANNVCGHPGMSVLRGRFVDVNAHSEYPGQAGVVQPRAASRNGIGLDDNVYQALLQNRIIFLGSEVRDENANAICAQMLLLNAEDPHRDIYLYINSPGGSVDSGMAIYDTMNWISNDVATVAMGLAASMGQFLLCAGTKGKRYALPHSRIMMHQPSGGLGGTASDIRIQAEQSLHIKTVMQKLIAEHTGQSLEQIEADSDRDRWFTAEEALRYGQIDHVYTSAAQIPSSEAPNQ
jgi:ATP-dependent Clp protease protease subunit